MIIRTRGLTKVYRIGSELVHALRGIDLDIDANEFVAIMGASGSGKSTLLNILGCLDQPTKGSYELAGRGTEGMNAAELAAARNQFIGFVFQSFELLPRATALKNVQLPLLYSKLRWRGATKRARESLERVGLADRTHHRPSQLSGGQRQRVAIARALVNEPTGNLDSATSDEILSLFHKLHAEGQTIVMVTHEEDIAGHATRIIRLKDGRILTDYPTSRDPMHQDYLRRVADAHARQREGTAS